MSVLEIEKFDENDPDRALWDSGDEKECEECELPLSECACDELEDRSASMWEDEDFLRDLRDEDGEG